MDFHIFPYKYNITNNCVCLYVCVHTINAHIALIAVLIYVVQVNAVILLLHVLHTYIHIYSKYVQTYVVHRQPNPMTLSQCPNLVGTGAQPASASRLSNNFMHINFYTYCTTAQDIKILFK